MLQDVFLVAIERNGRTLHAVAPTEVLHNGDVLWFAGSPDGVVSLRKVPGAPPARCDHVRLRYPSELHMIHCRCVCSP